MTFRLNIKDRKGIEKMKKINYYLCPLLNASFTLEAAVVFPIILAVILYIFLLIFSLHDTTVTKSISYRYLISYSMKMQDIYSYHDKVLHNINNEVQKESILNGSSDIFVKPEKNNLKITSSCYDIPVTFSNYNHTETLWAYKAGKTISNKSTKTKVPLP